MEGGKKIQECVAKKRKPNIWMQPEGYRGRYQDAIIGEAGRFEKS